VLSAAVAAHRSLAPDGLTALYVSDTEVDALLGRSAIAREASALPDRWCNDQLTALGERAGLLPFDQATLLLACAVASSLPLPFAPCNCWRCPVTSLSPS
jgi:hypothetical protein